MLKCCISDCYNDINLSSFDIKIKKNRKIENKFKNFGSKYYDLYGMPPEGKNENHPMHGLYMFKSNFGGKNIHRAGSFDVPLNMFYPLYSMLEKLRSFWHKVILKKIRGR